MPPAWWWGQAHGFDRPDVCVAFAGGRAGLGPLRATATALVVAVGDEVRTVVRPLRPLRVAVDERGWRLAGGGIEVEAHADGVAPHLLPVPVPHERRRLDDWAPQHLTGSLRLSVRRRGRTLYEGTSRARRPRARPRASRLMDDQGKRVSWVELYLDLVFVLAVAQLAHLIVAEPAMRSVWIALGLFFTLWWTWVGFAVLYNRLGADEPVQRLLFLAASVPIGVAAVAIEPASDRRQHGVRAEPRRRAPGPRRRARRHRRGPEPAERAHHAGLPGLRGPVRALGGVPEPLRYALWAVAIGVESSAMLAEDRDGARRLRRDHDLSALRPEDPRRRSTRTTSPSASACS